MQLQAALLDSGFAVQDPEKTKRFVREAVDAGLSCSLTNDDCVLKVGIAAGVDAVIVVRALHFDEKLVLELRMVSVEGQTTTGVAGLADDAAKLSHLARRLKDPGTGATTTLPVPIRLEPKNVLMSIDGRLVDSSQLATGALWLQPGPHLMQVSAAGFDTRSIAVDVSGDRLPPALAIVLERSFPLLQGVGVGIGLGGGLVAAVSLSGVGVVEFALNQPQQARERAGMTTLGRVLVGGTIVGLVAAGTGTALAVFGATE